MKNIRQYREEVHFPSISVFSYSVPFLTGATVLVSFLPLIFYTHTSLNIYLAIDLSSVSQSNLSLIYIFIIDISCKTFQSNAFKNCLKNAILLLNLTSTLLMDLWFVFNLWLWLIAMKWVSIYLCGSVG